MPTAPRPLHPNVCVFFRVCFCLCFCLVSVFLFLCDVPHSHASPLGGVSSVDSSPRVLRPAHNPCPLQRRRGSMVPANWTARLLPQTILGPPTLTHQTHSLHRHMAGRAAHPLLLGASAKMRPLSHLFLVAVWALLLGMSSAAFTQCSNSVGTECSSSAAQDSSIASLSACETSGSVSSHMYVVGPNTQLRPAIAGQAAADQKPTRTVQDSTRNPYVCVAEQSVNA